MNTEITTGKRMRKLIKLFNKVVDLFVVADKEYKKRKQVNEGDNEWFKNFDY